jgi:predicted CoA-binding protein
MKKTVIIGASPDPSRYSHMATASLLKHGHEVLPLGIRAGAILGVPIQTDRPESKSVDTVTLYLQPIRQPEWYDYIFSLQPKRIIFNPGTENLELEKMAKDKGIEAVEACTLVLLSTNQY